jgi:hypothetical protein
MVFCSFEIADKICYNKDACKTGNSFILEQLPVSCKYRKLLYESKAEEREK